MSTLSQDVASTSVQLPMATGSPTPLTIVLRKAISDMSDFFPFDDLADLSPNNDNDAFSFRGLIEDGIDGSQEILLLESGCHVDGVPNCPKACNDAELFFGSMETFYNCAALASISYWTQDSMMYFISEDAERNASAVMAGATLADFDDGPVLESFVGCALEACRDDGLSVPCDDDIRGLSQENSSPEEIFAAMANFCPEIEAEINPDIFGPGVGHRLFQLSSSSTKPYRCSSLTSFKSPSQRFYISLSRVLPSTFNSPTGPLPAAAPPSPSPASRP